jgi:uncharacterized protein (DUF2141 family)
MIKRIFLITAIALLLVKMDMMLSGCAQIMAPTGGPKDTIPPKLLTVVPAQKTTNFTGKKITLTFNEYVQLDQLQENLLVNPTPVIPPLIDYKFKTVTIKIRDTLKPNTTYSIDLGNSIQDLNEGNPFREYKYVFSTGPTIDTLSYQGKVIIARTGKTDSTIRAYLYKSMDDSAVILHKPDYIAKLNGEGNFRFSNIAPGKYKLYALRDNNGSRTYDSKEETFAFADSAVTPTTRGDSITLYAYAYEKPIATATQQSATAPKGAEKVLKFQTKLSSEPQELLSPLTIEFSNKLKTPDLSKIRITDTLFNAVGGIRREIDSTSRIVTLTTPWTENQDYRLIVSKDLGADTAGATLAKSDTIRFRTKRESEYGSVKLNFKNVDLTRKPVLQFVTNDQVSKSYPLTSLQWSAPMFPPGIYDLRILYDKNGNGKWDAGIYEKKIQPELVTPVTKQLTVRANWDNEMEIQL